MTTRVQVILDQLASEPDPQKRAALLRDFGAALEARLSKQNNTALEVMQAIENDVRDAIVQMQREIQEIRGQAHTHAKAEIERAERINHKLHNISNYLQALDHKINEQAELIHSLVDPYGASSNDKT